MTNAELIASLRRCSYTTVAGADREDGYCKPCAYFAEDPTDITCMDMMMIDAADALEAAEQRIAELNTKCADLQSQINSMESEIEELMPKEGEWIEENRRPKSYAFYCSVCHRTAYDIQGSRGDRPKRCRYAYCPNCGAKMKGEQK